MSVDVQELGKKPISDAAHTGVPSRDDPAYEALAAEFRKLELPEQPMVDWSGAIKNATEILETKSKDVMAGVYLAIAMFERDGYDGFAAGLGVLRDMATTYWDTMHPERVRPRQSAFQYLGDRGAKRVGQRGTDGAQHATLERIVATVGELDAIAGEKLEGGAGLLSDLARELRDVLERTAPAAPPPSAAPAPSAGPSPTPSPSFASSAPIPSSVGSEDDFDRAVQAVRPALRSLGEYKRMTNPRDPMAYRLPRIAAWMAIKQAPPANGGVTSIPAPPADVAGKIESKLAAQQWAGVLEETEGFMAGSVYWLDLHYWAYTALRGMGPEFVPASEAVAVEVRGLLQRLPELADLQFAGGRPLAGDAARAWVRETVLAAPGGGGGGARPSGGLQLAAEGGEPEGLAEAREQAAALVADNRLGEAVRLFEAGAARAIKARERAAWKVAVAQLCADAGRHDVALAQLEALQDDLQSTTLEAWDPELASQMLCLLLTARAKAVPAGAAAPEEHAKTRELLRRLARLDAAAALDFQRPAQ